MNLFSPINSREITSSVVSVERMNFAYCWDSSEKCQVPCVHVDRIEQLIWLFDDYEIAPTWQNIRSDQFPLTVD